MAGCIGSRVRFRRRRQRRCARDSLRRAPSRPQATATSGWAVTPLSASKKWPTRWSSGSRTAASAVVAATRCRRLAPPLREAPRLPIDACGDGVVAAIEAMICARPLWLRRALSGPRRRQRRRSWPACAFWCSLGLRRRRLARATLRTPYKRQSVPRRLALRRSRGPLPRREVLWGDQVPRT